MFASYLSWSINLVTQNRKIKITIALQVFGFSNNFSWSICNVGIYASSSKLYKSWCLHKLRSFLFLLCDQYHSQIKVSKINEVFSIWTLDQMIVICKSMMKLLILNLLFDTLHSKKVWCMLFINMLKTIIQQTRIDNIKNHIVPWSPSFAICCGVILNGLLKCFFEFGFCSSRCQEITIHQSRCT